MFATNLANKAYKAARKALAEGDHDLARAAIRWARRADSGNPLYIHLEAVLARKSGDRHEAERLYRRLADLAERTFGAGHARYVAVLAGLIELYDEMGRHVEAARLRNHAIDRLDRQSAADSGISALMRMADICLHVGRTADALSIVDAALARRRSVFGNGHIRVDECRRALEALSARIRLEPATARKPAAAFGPEILRRKDTGKEWALPA
jgi:tetratricopeptide (TPR) repeat protein